MADPGLPRQGRRRGRLRFGRAPLVAAARRRRGWEQMSASAFSVRAAIPAKGVEAIAGGPVIGGRRGARRRHASGRRLSRGFSAGEGMGWFLFRAIPRDEPAGFAPGGEKGCPLAGAARSFGAMFPPESWGRPARDVAAGRS